MAQFSRTWWGQRFIAALEEFTDPARLGRGRSYANGWAHPRLQAEPTARSQPKCEVRSTHTLASTKNPSTETSITIKAITAPNWTKVIRQIASRADLVTKLLMNEMPDTIEDAFSNLGLHLSAT